MRRRAVMSVLGATALIAASVVGGSSASALAMDATAPPVSFGSVQVYGSVTEDVVVTVSGSPVTFGLEPVAVPAPGRTQAEADDFFVVSNGCSGTIDAGETCTVTVEFNPFAAGLRQADLSIDTTSPVGTLLVGLSGTGVPNATGTYYGLSAPTRFLDTRSGNAPPLAAGSTTTVPILNRADIPASGVSAVVFNLTAVGTARNGYFTAYPSGRPRPGTSSINFPPGWTGANMVTVPVGADGSISLFNSGGTAHALVDVLGWYAKDDTVRTDNGMGAQFLSTADGDPVRIYDSRTDVANGSLPFGSLEFLDVVDTWTTPAEASAVKAYAVTVTATGATKAGNLTAYAGGALPKPSASTVNYQVGVTAPNMAVIPAGHFDPANPSFYQPDESGFRITNVGGTTHLFVDVTGYYVADDSMGLRFKPLTSVDAPVRILDTRSGVGLSGAFTASQTRTADASSVATPDSVYAVGNTTGIAPTAETFLTVWSGENPRPVVSNLNVNPNLTRAVSTYAPLSVDQTYDIYNRRGTMHVLFDAAGTLDLYPGQAGLPAGVPLSESRTADRTLGGRTIPGARSFAGGHESTTARRG